MQMTLLNQELAAKFGIYFEDCDTDPGTEWASFMQKSQEEIQQKPWLALAFSVDYKEGYPGGWSTGSESAPAGPGAASRLQEGASKVSCPVEDLEVAGGATEVPRGGDGYEEPIMEGGGMKVLIRVGDGNGVHVEEGSGSSLPFVEGGENEMPIVERGGNIEPIGEEGGVDEAGASVLAFRRGSKTNSIFSLASIGGIEFTAGFGESVGEEEADRDEQESVGNPDDEALPPSSSEATVLVKTQSESQADQLFASELSRLLRSIVGWSEKAVDYLDGMSQLKLQYHREAIWSVVFNGEVVDAWEGDEAIVASFVLELYGISFPWHIHTAPRFQRPVAHGEALDASVRLYSLVLIATKRVWVVGADNRELPAPLIFLVKALRKPLGRRMSPGFFRPAAEAALALVEFCKGSTSPGGMQRAVGVITLLKYAPQLSRRLVKPQKGSKGKARGGSQLDGGDDKRKGPAKKKPKAIVGTSKSDVGQEYRDVSPEKTDVGNVKTDVGAARMRMEDVEGKRAAADEVAYEDLEGAFEPECQSQSEKLAVTAVCVVFSDPEIQSLTSAGELEVVLNSG
jgi:hypothetical protein